ncbi:MAG: 16S rRNA (cytosine(1402)-N(4))-methyltransferase [Nitrosomonadaceae bacterium]|nr:16S rRNA (cytosine(1402)-N(4))-methyltransferase [Nitrosomonadaceae bacterium]|tara:strand:+ start:251 stop:1186 length:936 start_codon:yes stop_codon:yes gene_type:complete
MHVTVLLQEAVDALKIKSNGVYIDGTFGFGGHSQRILENLDKKGKLIAFDRDVSAVARGRSIENRNFHIIHSKFSKIKQELQELGVSQVDGVLLDLGMSSLQLEDVSRGFSFRLDGPLDMRMDTCEGQTAMEWIASASEAHLGEVIKNYGEERFAKQIAREIVMARSRQPITTTLQLAGIVAKVIRPSKHNNHPATRTFQAIRIYLNQELDELSLTLPDCMKLLKKGGRLVVISFHSLEDRTVKCFMREASCSDKFPRKLPIRDTDMQHLVHPKLRLVGRAKRPKDSEIEINPRARSAVMRVAERINVDNL